MILHEDPLDSDQDSPEEVCSTWVPVTEMAQSPVLKTHPLHAVLGLSTRYVCQYSKITIFSNSMNLSPEIEGFFCRVDQAFLQHQLLQLMWLTGSKAVCLAFVMFLNGTILN